LDKFIIVFIDNMLIYSPSEKTYREPLKIILSTLRDRKLYVKFSKCDYWLREIAFLGHIMSEQGTSVDPTKVKAVKKWPRLTTISEIRSFLGLTEYYCQFVERFSSIATPLTQLTWKKG